MFQVRDCSALCFHGGEYTFYLVQVVSHLHGTFKLASKKKSERQIVFFLPLNTYATSALSFCTLTKKKINTLIALETVFSESRLREQVADQALRKQQGGPYREHFSCHLFLHTFDNQIFTVLSLKRETERGRWDDEQRKARRTQQREKMREDQSDSLPFQNNPLYVRHNTKRLTSKCASHTLAHTHFIKDPSPGCQ